VLAKEARKRVGTGYRLLGEMQASIVRTTILDRTRGIVTLTLTLAATYVYELSPGVKQHLVQLIAGKTKQQAITILLQFPCIQAASIQLAGGNPALPDDPSEIHLIVMYQGS